jgi:hypothetical protein
VCGYDRVFRNLIHQELASLLALLRANNVRLYKSNELELHLGPSVFEFQDEALTKREEREAKEEEDVTFAHVGG